MSWKVLAMAKTMSRTKFILFIMPLLYFNLLKNRLCPLDDFILHPDSECILKGI